MIARLNLGGPAHQAALLSGRRMDPERYETLLVHGAVAPGEESAAHLAEREEAATVFVPTLQQPVNPVSDARAFARLASIMREFRPHIVHTHTAKAGFLGRLAAMSLRGRPKIVHTFHGHVLEGYFGAAKTELYRRLERALGRRTDVLIGVSDATVDDLVRLGVASRERFRVVRLGLDLRAYVDPPPGAREQLRARLGLTNDELLVIFVGRLVPIKRLDVMLDALAAAVARDGAIHLAIVGDGEIRGQLEAQARTLGIDSRVHFLGYQRELAPIFAAGDLAAISSDNEGTPVSLIEGAAAGLPALATDVGGVRATVTPATGVVVPPRDPSAFADALLALAADHGRRRTMGNRARAHVSTSFSAERLLAEMDSVYGSLSS